jgi:hypothetical protein
MTIKRNLFSALALIGVAGPALAHHSFAMFDADKTINMPATVKEFEWTNPHSWMHVTAVDEASGQPVDWSFEMGSPGQLGSRGMKPDSVKPGDKIIVRVHPMKDGSHGGQYLSASFADGRPVAGNPRNANGPAENAGQ